MKDIKFQNTLGDISPNQLTGFFVGWPNPPSPEALLIILNNSYCFELAIDINTNQVVAFTNAISDGVLSAYIPLLETIPEYQGNRIATELITRLKKKLEDIYMVDLCCDENLEPFYKRFGFEKHNAMIIRNYDVLK